VSGQYSLLRRVLRGENIPPLDLALSYIVPTIIIVMALAAVARLLSRESAVAGK